MNQALLVRRRIQETMWNRDAHFSLGQVQEYTKCSFAKLAPCRCLCCWVTCSWRNKEYIFLILQGANPEECLCRSNHLWCIASFLNPLLNTFSACLVFWGHWLFFFFSGIIALYHYIRVSGVQHIQWNDYQSSDFCTLINNVLNSRFLFHQHMHSSVLICEVLCFCM